MVNTEDKKPKTQQKTSKDVMDEVITQFNLAVTAKLDGKITEEQFAIEEQKATKLWNDWVAENREKHGQNAVINLEGYQFNKYDNPDFYQLMPSGLDLEGANLYGADLSGTIFKEVNLLGADLRNCTLEGTTICSGSRLGYSEGYEKSTNFADSSITNVDLSNNVVVPTPIEKLEFGNYRQSGISFMAASINGSVDFSGTSLEGSNFTGVMGSGPIELKYDSGTKLNGISIDATTLKRLPADFIKAIEVANIEVEPEKIISAVPTRPVATYAPTPPTTDKKIDTEEPKRSTEINIYSSYAIGSGLVDYTLKGKFSDYQTGENSTYLGSIRKNDFEGASSRYAIGLNSDIPLLGNLSLYSAAEFNKFKLGEDKVNTTEEGPYFTKEQLNFTIAPKYRFNENFSLYAGLGISTGNISLNSFGYDNVITYDPVQQTYSNKELPAVSNVKDKFNSLNFDAGALLELGKTTLDLGVSIPDSTEREGTIGNTTRANFGITQDILNGWMDIGLKAALELGRGSDDISGAIDRDSKTADVNFGFKIGVNILNKPTGNGQGR